MRADAPTDIVITPTKSAQNSTPCHLGLRSSKFANWSAANKIMIPVTIINRSRLLLHQSANLRLWIPIILKFHLVVTSQEYLLNYFKCDCRPFFVLNINYG